MKILLVQHINFINGSGGTEKICSFLANNFVSKGHSVEIATNENISGKPIFFLHKDVKVTNIFNSKTIQKLPLSFYNYKGKNPFLWLKFKVQKKKAKFYNKKIYREFGGEEGVFEYNLLQRSRDWKNYIEKLSPDIIITMSISSLLEITFKNDFRIPIVNSTNGRPDYDYTDILWYRSPTEMRLLKESYHKLTGIQILFESYRDFLPDTFNGKCFVIPNPVPQFEENSVKYDSNKSRFKIVNIASLVTSCKQQNIAIDIFAKLKNKFSNWDLYFWGVGQDYELLKELIKKNNLENRVFLMGFANNPIDKLKDADAFIFPSKYEGFPLALTEAMSVGLPCLGFKTCSGVNELIINLQNGFLAADNDEMGKYLEQLFNDTEIRKKLGEQAYQDMKKYNPKFIFEEWQKLILSFEYYLD